MIPNRLKNLIQQQTFQIIFLIILIIFSYFNILQNTFAWDDYDFIVNWESIKSVEYLPSLIMGEIPNNHQGVYRPIRSILYVFSYKLWGLNPFGYHIQAICVHLLITILIYFIINIITKKRFLAFIIAILFATHPIHTESITYITASFDTIGILFFFISFCFFLRSKRDKKERLTSQIMSYIYAFLAFFTYEMTLTLPILIVFYDFCYHNLNVKNFFKRLILYKYYFIILAFYVIVRELWLNIGDRSKYLGEIFFVAAHQARVATPEILIEYSRLLIFPQNLSISHIIPTNFLFSTLRFINSIDKSGHLINILGVIDIFIPLLLIAILLFIFLKIFKKQPIIAFGAGWLILALLPVLNTIHQGAIIAERFLYIPSFGFSILLGYTFYLLFKFLRKQKNKNYFIPAVILFFSSVVFFYVVTTRERNIDWQNEKTIWLSVLKINPTSALAKKVLGLIYFRNGDTNQAIDLFKKSLILDNSDFKVHTNLGLAYEKNRESKLAIQSYENAIKAEPAFILSYFHLGDLYAKQGNFDQAINQYKSALKINPNHSFIHYNMGVIYEKSGDSKNALLEYKENIRLNPRDSKSYNNMGIIYIKQNKIDDAIGSFKTALKLSPKNPNIYSNLGLAYEKKGDKTSAIELYKKEINLHPNEKIQSILDKLTSQ